MIRKLHCLSLISLQWLPLSSSPKPFDLSNKTTTIIAYAYRILQKSHLFLHLNLKNSSKVRPLPLFHYFFHFGTHSPLISHLYSSFAPIPTGVSFDLSDKDLFCVEEQDIFDRVYSLIRDYSNLSPSCKLNIVESLRSNFSVLLPNIDSLARASSSNDADAPVLDQIASYRNAFKIYTFFLLNIVTSEESSGSSSNNSKVVC